MEISIRTGAFAIIWLLTGMAAASNPIPQPFPRVVYTGEVVHRFVTDNSSTGVVAAGTAEAEFVDGHLRLAITGNDPQIILSGFSNAEGPLCLSFRARLTGGGMGELFWGDSMAPGFSGDRQVSFLTEYDSVWHAYSIPIPSSRKLTDLRLDLGSERGGTIDISDIVLHHGGRHPLEIITIAGRPDSVIATVRNHSDQGRLIRYRDRDYNIAANAAREFAHPLVTDRAVQAANFTFASTGLPPVERRVWVHNHAVDVEANTLTHGDLRLEVARDGSVARIFRRDQLQVVMAPLAMIDGHLPKWTSHIDDSTVYLKGEVNAAFRFDDDGMLSIHSDASAEMEMVVRAVRNLEQAVFPGLEYLSKGEHSSSRLDFHTDQHFRFMPKPLEVTWPALMMVTDQQSIALRWDDNGARPTFASPNFVDGCSDHRMTLRGEKIRAKLRLTKPEPITESILWAAQDLGLPALPKRPRSEADQATLCRRAYEGPLRDANGWGHCVEKRYPRRWYADLASGYWAAGGELPELPKLVAGGGHIRDERSFFLTNNARTWLHARRAGANGVLREIQPDGSFRYTGKYRKGHFEDTASGYCALRAVTLLRFAELTGDDEARSAGLKALEYMHRFKTPRGAQTWELSLHTPDILAAANLVEAYMIGHRLSGKKHYVAEARKWALSGLPFVYLRGDKPAQAYATIPVFGASSWVAPNWIGKPVQWNGLVYAHAVARLAKHDDTFPWQQLAKGIVIAAERMQEADGPSVGCLPDYWFLASGHGGGPAINPSVIQSAAARAWGRPTGLQTIVHDGHHVASPFPLTVDNGVVRARSKPGTVYQVVIDGERITEVTGTANDVIELEQDSE